MAAWPVPGVPAGTGLVRLRKFLTPGTQTITMTEAAGGGSDAQGERHRADRDGAQRSEGEGPERVVGDGLRAGDG